MIYFLVTCSLVDKHPTPWIIKLPESYRIKEYAIGIESILKLSATVPNSRVILIENNGPRHTFLSLYPKHTKGCELFYTQNNSLETINKGIKELKDIKDCIDHYKIQDDDFIVKLSGRYQVLENSPFLEILKTLPNHVDCMLRYGSFNGIASPVKMKDCITGLIGMRCKFVKQIETPDETDPVEWKWASVTYSIDDTRIVIMNRLGLSMRPMNTAPLTV